LTLKAIFLLLLLSACAPQQNSRPALAIKRNGAIYHVVKPGENLYRIGKAYDVSYEQLARVNNLRDPTQIRVGQRLLIPEATRALPVEIITPTDSAPTPRETEPPDIAGDALLWPVQGTINSGFGARGSSFHDGIDIAAMEGTPIRAVDGGEVIYSDQLRGYGNIVIIRHSGGLVSVYAHNQINLVRDGQKIERGDVVAKVGSTGRVTGPHLHFEIRKNNAAQNPLRYLPQLCCAPASDNVTPKS
jgi:murein DD-endopeptidase MepM/ murein hydrolase activator NlpD